MSKGAKQKKRRKTRLHTAQPIQRARNAPSTTGRTNYKALVETLFRLNAIDKYIGLTGVVALTIFQLSVNEKFMASHPNANTILRVAMFSLGFLLLSAHILISVLEYKHPLTLTEKWVRRWFAVKMSSSVLMLSICVFLTIYVFGVVDAISAFIRAHWQSASNLMVSVVSTLASFIISGVIGNFAYDVLKRLVLRRKGASGGRRS
jgi:hypothetical protein